MDRRPFLATLGSLAALDPAAAPAANNGERVRTTSNTPPRKVIVGTFMQSFWGQYPGLRNRLEQLEGIVDQMAAQAKQTYGRGLDLAILPEVAITGEAGDDALERGTMESGSTPGDALPVFDCDFGKLGIQICS